MPPIEVLAKMAYGSGMKNQAIWSRDRAMEILMTTDELIIVELDRKIDPNKEPEEGVDICSRPDRREVRECYPSSLSAFRFGENTRRCSSHKKGMPLRKSRRLSSEYSPP